MGVGAFFTTLHVVSLPSPLESPDCMSACLGREPPQPRCQSETQKERKRTAQENFSFCSVSGPAVYS